MNPLEWLEKFLKKTHAEFDSVDLYLLEHLKAYESDCQSEIQSLRDRVRELEAILNSRAC